MGAVVYPNVFVRDRHGIWYHAIPVKRAGFDAVWLCGLCGKGRVAWSRGHVLTSLNCRCCRAIYAVQVQHPPFPLACGLSRL